MVFAGAALIVAVVAGWFGVPVFMVLSVGLVVAGFSAARPEFTGPKDASGYPTPLGREQEKYLRYLRMSDLRWRHVVPNGDWWPGVPPRVSALGAVCVAWGAWFVPVHDVLALSEFGAVVQAVNSVCAFGVVSAVSGALRRYASEFGTRPAVSVADVVRVLRSRPVLLMAAAVGGALVAGVTAGVLVAQTIIVTHVGVVGFWACVPVGVGVALFVVWVSVRREVLAPWNVLVDSRHEWKARWEALNRSPIPSLDSVETLGHFTVESFTASTSAAEFIDMSPKIASQMGGGRNVAVIASPNTDRDGSDIPGSVHPNRFRVVSWDLSSASDVSEATADEGKRLVLHSALWSSRWSRVAKWKKVSHPIPVGFEEVPGPEGHPSATAVTFDVPNELPITDVLDSQTTFASAVGQVRNGFVGAFCPVPEVGADGQPIPGTQSGTRFQYVEVPSGVSAADPSMSAQFVYQLLRVHMSSIAMREMGRPPEIVGIESVSGVEAFGAWKFEYVTPNERAMSLMYVRTNFLDELRGALQSDVLALDGESLLVGGIDFEGFEFSADSGVTMTMVESARIEDEWRDRWSLLFDNNREKAPKIQSNLRRTMTLANGVEVHQEGFVARQSQPMKDLFACEPKLSSVLRAAPFASIVPAPDGKADRRGARHPMGLLVHWSHGAVPTKPDVLAPVRGFQQAGNQWVLSAMLTWGFQAAKLAAPQVFDVEPLSSPSSPVHLWLVRARLYGGVTLAEVRRGAATIRRFLGSAYLRVGEGADSTVEIILGGLPSEVELERPQKTDPMIAALDWEQAFIDAGVKNSEGVTPQLVAFRRLELNDTVMVVTFRLPSGVTVSTVRAAREKLTGPTGFAFIQVSGTESANEVEIMCSVANPMPSLVPFDESYVLSTGADVIPFGAGLDGSPVVFDIKQNTHLLVLGGQGSGKSAGLQAILVPCAMKGLELFIADPMKGAADFQFLRPWARAFVDHDPNEDGLYRLAAMLRSVYQMVVERKAVNVAHAVGNYRDLPEEVRPRQAVVVIDEFTSLVMLEPEPKQSPDPEIEADREKLIARNTTRKEIATFVGKIIREARSVGVTMLIATQKMTNEMLKGLAGINDVKTNTATIVMGKSKDSDRVAAGMVNPYDVPELGESVPKGRGLYESVESGVQMVQFAFEPGGQAALARMVESVRAPLSEGELMDYEHFLRLPDVQDGPAVEMLPPEQVDVVEDLGDFEWDDDDWLTDSGSEPVGGAPEGESEADTVSDESVTAPAAEVEEEPVPAISSVVMWNTRGVFCDDDGQMFDGADDVLSATALLSADAHVWLTHDDPEVCRTLTDAAGIQPWEVIGADESGSKFPGLVRWLNEHMSVRRVIVVDTAFERAEVESAVADVLSAAGRQYHLYGAGGVDAQALEWVENALIEDLDLSVSPRIIDEPGGNSDDGDVDENVDDSGERDVRVPDMVYLDESDTRPETEPDVEVANVSAFVPDIPTIEDDDGVFISAPKRRRPRPKENPFA